jgi:hypothetical protein
MSAQHLQEWIEGFGTVQIRDPYEGGPKSNRNTFGTCIINTVSTY